MLVAVLHRGIFFDHGVVGKAIKGPICTHQFSGGVSMVSLEQGGKGWMGWGVNLEQGKKDWGEGGWGEHDHQRPLLYISGFQRWGSSRGD